MSHEVIHFDVNKTIITTDKASGQSVETLIDGLVARNIYGRVSIDPNGPPFEDLVQSFGIPKPDIALPQVPPRSRWRFLPVAPDDPVAGGQPMPPARVLASGRSHGPSGPKPSWGRATSLTDSQIQLKALRSCTVGAAPAGERGATLLDRVTQMTQEGKVTSLENFLQEYAYPIIPLQECESRGYDKVAARSYNKDVAKHFRRRVLAAFIRGLSAAPADGDGEDVLGSSDVGAQGHEILSAADTLAAEELVRCNSESKSAAGGGGDVEVEVDDGTSASPPPASDLDANARVMQVAIGLEPVPPIKVGLKQLLDGAERRKASTTATDCATSEEHLLESFTLGMAGEEEESESKSSLESYRSLLFRQWKRLVRLSRLSQGERASVVSLLATTPDQRHASARSLPEPMQALQRGIVPAFFRFVEAQLLDPERRSRFAIVFRTFGSDIPDIAAEWNLYCSGEHPYEQAPPELGSLDGSSEHGIDMRMRLPEDTACIHRSGFMGEHLSVATVRTSGSAPMLLMSCQQLVGYRALNGWLKDRITSGRRCLAVRDCYKFWNDCGEIASAGKVVLVDARSWEVPASGASASGEHAESVVPADMEDIHPIFFDDNVLRRRAKIVDARVIPPDGNLLGLSNVSNVSSVPKERSTDGAGSSPSGTETATGPADCDCDTDEEVEAGFGAETLEKANGVPDEARLPFALTRGVVTVRCEISEALVDPRYFVKEVAAARLMWPSFKEQVAARFVKKQLKA